MRLCLLFESLNGEFPHLLPYFPRPLLVFWQEQTDNRADTPIRRPQATLRPTDSISGASPARRQLLRPGVIAPPNEQPTPVAEEPQSSRITEIKIGARPCATRHRRMMPIKNRDGDTEARMFFMAYTLDNRERNRRPLTFSLTAGRALRRLAALGALDKG